MYFFCQANKHNTYGILDSTLAAKAASMGATLDAKYSLRSNAVAVSESDVVVMRGYDFVGANAEAHCIVKATMAAFRRVIFRSCIISRRRAVLCNIFVVFIPLLSEWRDE